MSWSKTELSRFSAYVVVRNRRNLGSCANGSCYAAVVNVGVLYERLGEEAVNEIATWLDQVYGAKAEIDALRRDVKELLREVRAIELKHSEDLAQPAHSNCHCHRRSCARAIG